MLLWIIFIILCLPICLAASSDSSGKKHDNHGGFSSLFDSGDDSGRKKDTGRCDGDCANCPPHYGYRYGRWYYGRHHRHGCQRGGNGGL